MSQLNCDASRRAVRFLGSTIQFGPQIDSSVETLIPLEKHDMAMLQRSLAFLMFVLTCLVVSVGGGSSLADDEKPADPLASEVAAEAREAEARKDNDQAEAARAEDAKKAAETKDSKAEDAKPAEKEADAEKKEGEKSEKKDDTGKDEKGKEEKGKDESKEAKPKPRNPLTDIIIRSFKPARGTPAVPVVETEPVPEKKGAAKKHPKDATAPYDQKAAAWLQKARGHAEAGEWKNALDFLQKINELSEDSLVDDSGSWVSIRVAADRLRGSAPAELIDEYRVQFGGLAKQMLAEAVRAQSPGGLGRVARGYFHTPAGYEAANRLGTYHLERGEYASAARWFESLWEARPPFTEELAWRSKAAFALRAAGKTEPAEKVILELASRSTVIGGKSQSVGNWWKETAIPDNAASGAQRDWPMHMGSPTRTGHLQGGTPLLLSRWQHRITESEPVREQIANLLEDMADGQAAPVPVIHPILVDGLIAFRTLGGVQVLEADTGKPLWSSIEEQSINRLLSGAQNNNQSFMGGQVFFRGGGFGNFGYNVGSGEHSPLARLLFFNSNFGLLSSDGVRLFVLEDDQFLNHQQPGQFWGWGNNENTQGISTRLTAYDLRNGRPLWEVGGKYNGEDLDPPLAGYFLFGPPVIDGHEMFVIGEATTGDRSGQIRLICLDPSTGTELWSQLVAYADTGIEKDIGRRWFSAQPTLENGLILCPTTVGWLVAVDRATRSVVWGFRAPRPQNVGRQMGPDGSELGQMVQQFQLSTVWLETPPIAVNGRVIFSVVDPQVQDLFCIEQATGKLLWKKPRGTGMYVAGVHQQLVLAVGRDTTVAYRLSDGEPAWTAKHGLPTGRGVIANGHLQLPLSGGEVATINLEKGEIVNRTFLPEQSTGGVGNLLTYRGMLLSVDPFHLTAFEQKEAVQEQITERKKADPNDALALLREADIALLQREYPQALALLRNVHGDRLPEGERNRLRRNLVESLIANIRADFSRPDTDTDFAQLEQLVSGPDESLAFRQLQADRFKASKQFVPAFEAYIKLATDSANRMVPLDESPGVTVRADHWVAGKLVDLTNELPEDQKGAIEARIQEMATLALSGSSDDCQRFVRLFPEHALSLEIRMKLADEFLKQQHFSRAEFQLRRVMRVGNPQHTALAGVRLAQALHDRGLADDARVIAERLLTEYGMVELEGGKTVTNAVEMFVAQLPVVEQTGSRWGANGVRIERMPANYQNYVPQELHSLGPQTPFFSRFRLDIDPQTQRLNVFDERKHDVYWAHPLRSGPSGQEGGIPFARASGHLVLLMQNGVLQAVSPVDKTIVWSRTLDMRVQQQYYGRQQTPFLAMRPIASGGNRQPIQLPLMQGALSLVSDEVICVSGRRSLQVLDTETGELRWQYNGMRTGTALQGGNKVLYLGSYDPQQVQQMAMMGIGVPSDGRPQRKGAPSVLRLLDGKRIEIPKLKEMQSKALMTVGDDFILTANVEGGTELRRFNPTTGKDAWKTVLRKGSIASVLDSDRLAVIEPSVKASKEVKDPLANTLALLDVHSGRRQSLEITGDDIKAKNEVFVFADRESAYLVVNKPGGVQNYYNEQLPYVRINGIVSAFSLTDGKQRWKQPINGQNLLLERFEFLPVMVFVTRKFDNRGALNVWTMHMIAVDKTTGQKLHDEKSAQQPGFRSMTWNPKDRYIEIRGWNDRMRLFPAEVAVKEPEKPAPPPEPSAEEKAKAAAEADQKAKDAAVEAAKAKPAEGKAEEKADKTP